MRDQTSTQKEYPTYWELERLYQKGNASIAVDHGNHREFIYNGTRYFCGWDSSMNDNTGEVWGWHTYKAEAISTPDQTPSPQAMRAIKRIFPDMSDNLAGHAARIIDQETGVAELRVALSTLYCVCVDCTINNAGETVIRDAGFLASAIEQTRAALKATAKLGKD